MHFFLTKKKWSQNSRGSGGSHAQGVPQSIFVSVGTDNQNTVGRAAVSVAAHTTRPCFARLRQVLTRSAAELEVQKRTMVAAAKALRLEFTDKKEEERESG